MVSSERHWQSGSSIATALAALPGRNYGNRGDDMALVHNIIETRQEGNRWRTRLRVVDSDTGLQYIRKFHSETDPDQTQLDALGALAISRIQNELDMKANAMNLKIDETRLLEEYRKIKRDVVLRIRAFPEATSQQAKDYIAVEYPNSPFNFDELYAIWIGMINVSTWADFKTWVIDKKFKEID